MMLYTVITVEHGKFPFYELMDFLYSLECNLHSNSCSISIAFVFVLVSCILVIVLCLLCVIVLGVSVVGLIVCRICWWSMRSGKLLKRMISKELNLI